MKKILFLFICMLESCSLQPAIAAEKPAVDSNYVWKKKDELLKEIQNTINQLDEQEKKIEQQKMFLRRLGGFADYHCL